MSCVLSVWSQDITLLQCSKDDMNTNLKTTVVVYNGEAEEQDKEQYNLLLTKLWWRRKFSYLAASDSHFNEVAKKQWIKANVLIDCGCYGTLCLDALAKKMGCSCSTKNQYKLWINHACVLQLTNNAVRIDLAKCVSDNWTDTYLNKSNILSYSPEHGNPIGGYLTRISSYPHLNNIKLPILEHSYVNITIGMVFTNNEHLLITVHSRDSLLVIEIGLLHGKHHLGWLFLAVNREGKKG